VLSMLVVARVVEEVEEDVVVAEEIVVNVIHVESLDIVAEIVGVIKDRMDMVVAVVVAVAVMGEVEEDVEGPGLDHLIEIDVPLEEDRDPDHEVDPGTDLVAIPVGTEKTIALETTTQTRKKDQLLKQENNVQHPEKGDPSLVVVTKDHAVVLDRDLFTKMAKKMQHRAIGTVIPIATTDSQLVHQWFEKLV